ncbi:type II toxin-antitoxin system RelE/ParE family toxin [Mesorhizobium sp. LHD-90]|uniref:type II toxin-antitoxin system RelE/ParE family toxin n=1 Tax=Mesorhizobium sp. LHD-90 TaxID=3071414 RepID=UPI0027DF192E|nr:type II toxin-antitoxin system RelE/ParE family toxin [Mesorhizobium sp. LHD-90]MDQ6432439.1 type II toxin-antitoxin system RelE/ParE family toxin [Mesorhizobium sp. LHD-90]
MRRRTVDYSLRANRDFAWIYGTVAEVGGTRIAFNYVQRVRAFCEKLEYGSERGTRRDELRPGLRVVGFERRISVAFMVEPERVVILRVFYGGMDWENEFGDND